MADLPPTPRTLSHYHMVTKVMTLQKVQLSQSIV